MTLSQALFRIRAEGLDTRMAEVLVHIGADPSTVWDLGQRTGLPRSTIQNSVRGLEALGMVGRRRGAGPTHPHIYFITSGGSLVLYRIYHAGPCQP